LVERLAPRVAEILKEGRDSDVWLNSNQAAEHLGMTRNALHKLTSARQIPFSQDGPGCKLYFRRVDLDRWRGGGSIEKVGDQASRPLPSFPKVADLQGL
jgi:hypothetical protein